jgi:diguanylate cyclase (GGDEF)-like protein
LTQGVSSILVVDDDPTCRAQMEGPLREEGYRVESCSDGQAALEKVRAFRPDVVVTDWEMPRMDGLTLCRLIKGIEELRFTHVIILSSRGETASKVAGLDTGADDYIVKPADPTELKARVRSGLRLQRALSELSAKNELLEHLALTDSLTNLANRRAFEESLGQEVSRTARQCKPLALLFLDLDHFKLVNDTWGHAVGDEVLVDFASTLARLKRRGDLAARIGGEEFAVLLPHTDRTQAGLVAERIRRAVAAAPLGRSRPVPITVSIGVAWLPGPDKGDAATLLQNADTALYRAKDEGRNRVAVL